VLAFLFRLRIPKACRTAVAGFICSDCQRQISTRSSLLPGNLLIQSIFYDFLHNHILLYLLNFALFPVIYSAANIRKICAERNGEKNRFLQKIIFSPGNSYFTCV